MECLHKHASALHCALRTLAAKSAGYPGLYSTCKAMKESYGQMTGRWIISTADVPVLQELHSCGTTPDKDLCTEGNLAGRACSGSLAWNPCRCSQTFSAGSYFTAHSMTSHLTGRWRLWPLFSFDISSAPHPHLRTLRTCQPLSPPHTPNPSLPLRHATLQFMQGKSSSIHHHLPPSLVSFVTPRCIY